jgi:hypothetical protein
VTFGLDFCKKIGFVISELVVGSGEQDTHNSVRKDMAEILDKCGIVSGHDMTLPSAVTKMALTLMKKIELPNKMRLMSQNWQGEIR